MWAYTKWRRLARLLFTISIFGAVAAPLLAIYVWEDRPDASDTGKHTLSGWLVGCFGDHWAQLAGTVIFSGAAVLFVAIMLLLRSTVRGPWRQRRLFRRTGGTRTWQRRRS
jgi:hypothetical protein